MRVAIVCPYDLGAFGGVQDQCFKLAGWLEAAGHSATVIGPGDAPPGAVSLGPVRTVIANGAATPIGLRRGLGHDLAAATAGADVVHVHEPLMPAVSTAAARLRDVPLVGTFHADPSSLIRRLYRVGSVPLRRMLSRLDVVTAVSPVAARAVDPIATARIVPNGVDRATFGTGPKAPRSVGFVGRDDPRKGLDVLLAAWPVVADSVPGARLRVMSDATRPAPSGIDFLGAGDDDAKRRLLAETAVMCAPNLAGESFGIVLVESMASQCAVVASALPAFVNVVGDTAVLVKPGDPEGLARALIRLLLDAREAASLARAGRERALRFDRAAVLAGYLDAYRDAVAVHRSAPAPADAEG